MKPITTLLLALLLAACAAAGPGQVRSTLTLTWTPDPGAAADGVTGYVCYYTLDPVPTPATPPSGLNWIRCGGTASNVFTATITNPVPSASYIVTATNWFAESLPSNADKAPNQPKKPVGGALEKN